MTINIYEFSEVDGWGNPVHPANVVTRAKALNSDHALASTTRCVQIVPATNVRLYAGEPEATDYYVAANGLATMRVQPGAGTVIQAEQA